MRMRAVRKQSIEEHRDADASKPEQIPGAEQEWERERFSIEQYDIRRWNINFKSSRQTQRKTKRDSSKPLKNEKLKTF